MLLPNLSYAHGLEPFFRSFIIELFVLITVVLYLYFIKLQIFSKILLFTICIFTIYLSWNYPNTTVAEFKENEALYLLYFFLLPIGVVGILSFVLKRLYK